MKQFIVPYLRDQPIWWEDSCMTRNAFFVDANLYFFCKGGVFIYYFLALDKLILIFGTSMLT